MQAAGPSSVTTCHPCLKMLRFRAGGPPLWTPRMSGVCCGPPSTPHRASVPGPRRLTSPWPIEPSPCPTMVSCTQQQQHTHMHTHTQRSSGGGGKGSMPRRQHGARDHECCCGGNPVSKFDWFGKWADFVQNVGPKMCALCTSLLGVWGGGGGAACALVLEAF